MNAHNLTYPHRIVGRRILPVLTWCTFLLPPCFYSFFCIKTIESYLARFRSMRTPHVWFLLCVILESVHILSFSLHAFRLCPTWISCPPLRANTLFPLRFFWP